MGRNMFGPIRGDWDEEWTGWWGVDASAQPAAGAGHALQFDEPLTTWTYRRVKAGFASAANSGRIGEGRSAETGLVSR
jgi:hypothetical protein